MSLSPSRSESADPAAESSHRVPEPAFDPDHDGGTLETLEGARILLADDDPVMREYARLLLLDHGAKVEAVADGDEAWSAIQSGPPDLVLLDLIMPRMTGIDVLGEIRADETLRTLPVIMLSGQTSEDAKVEGLGAGADDYLTKPYSERELLARVGGQLAMTRLRNQMIDRERQLRAEADQLNEIALDLASELDLHALVKKVTNAGTSLTGAQFGAFFDCRSDESAGERPFQLYALAGIDAEEFARIDLRNAAELLESAFEGEGVVRIRDAGEDADHANGVSAQVSCAPLYLRSCLAVPVVSKARELIGGLIFGHPRSDAFDARAERFAKGIAAQAAVALDNARLYARARTEIDERRRAEQELARLRDLLSVELDAMTQLHAVSTKLMLDGDFPSLLSTVIDGALEITGADMGQILLLDPDNGVLRLAARRGFESGAASEFGKTGDSKTFCELALNRGERIIISHVFGGSEAEDEIQAAMSHAGIRAAQATPLLTRKGRALGVFCTFYRVVHQPDEREVRLLDLLARQAADLIERKRGEESRALMAAIVESSTDAIISATLDGTITSWNAGARALYGYAAAEAVGQPVSMLIPSDRFDQDADMIDRIRRGEQIGQVETVRVAKDGRRIEVALTISPVQDSSGRVIGVSKIVRDITARNRMEQEINRLNQDLRARVHELETLQEMTPVGVLIAHDAECKVITANRAGAAILGMADTRANLSVAAYNAGELPFRTVRDGAEVPVEELPMLRCARTGEEVVGELYDQVFEDGTVLHTQISASPLRDVNGNPRGCIATIVDITANMRAERAVRESEARFVRFMQYLPGLAWIKDSAGRYVFVNDAAAQAFNRSRKDLYGKRDEEVFPPDTAAQFRANDLEALEQGAGLETMETLEHADGLHHSIVSKFPIPDPAGGPPLVGGMAIDITDRVTAERSLRDSEVRFRSLAMNAPAAIYIKDMDGKYRMANPLACAALGKDDVTGLCDHDLMPSAWADQLREHDLKVIVTGEPLESEERINVGGVVREFLSVKFPLLNAEGRPTGVCGVSVDITARKRAEKALTQSVERIKLLAGVSEQLLTANDPLSVVNSLCQNVAEFLDCDFFTVRLLDEDTGRLHMEAFQGISDESLHSVRWTGMSPSVSGEVAQEGRCRTVPRVQDTVDPAFARIRRLGLQAYTCHPLHVAGRTIGTLSFGSRSRPEFSDADIELVKSVADQVAIAMERLTSRQALLDVNVTLEQRVHERTMVLIQQRQQLRRLAAELTTAEQRERKRLASLLHDDLQQLLVSAKMLMGTVERKRDNPEDLLATCGRVQQLIEDSIESARDMSRQLRPPVLYEDGLVPALYWLASEMHRIHGLKIAVSADENVEPADDDQRAFLFECVRELLLNIVKHAGVQHAYIEAGRTENDMLQIVVRDEGCGFESDPGSADGPSEGFGLFSIRERLASIGGRIAVHSTPGRGTVTTLEVPLLDTQLEYNRPMPEPEFYDAPIERGNKRIGRGDATRVLVVDDHTLVREGIAAMIAEDADFRVVGQASDGIEAIEAVQAHHPQIVLMDLNMPRMNGIEATRAICRQWPGIVIVGLSVQEDETTAKSVVEAGASIFLSKSSTPEQIMATMRSLAQSAQSRY